MALSDTYNQWIGNPRFVIPTLTSGVSPNLTISVEIVGAEKYKEDYIPTQIIQREDSKTTILVWKDGSKTIVHCSPDEEFIPEFGVAMATMNKIYGNRNKFKKFLDKKVFWQDKAKKVKKEEVKVDEDLQGLAKAMNDIADGFNKGAVV